MAKNSRELIESPLSQSYTAEGETLEVSIYRLHNSKWLLEVTDSQGTHTVWEEEFTSDQDAWNEFLKDVTENGIAQFIAKPSDTTLH
jgi:hypothetical protein